MSDDGSSTGGIIAIALGLGHPAKQIVSFYEKFGPSIFKQQSILRRFVTGSVQIDAGALERAVTDVFGLGRRFRDSTTRLAIPSTDSKDHKPHIFKTGHRPELIRDENVTVVEVVRATTNVPLALRPYDLQRNRVSLLDGGMWANNPIAFAVIEAVNLKWWPCEDVRVLSLGCTSSRIDSPWERHPLALLARPQTVIGALLAIQSAAAMTMAQNLLDDRTRILRIDPELSTRCRLDDVSRIGELRDLGVREARQQLRTVKERFFSDGPREAFTPCAKQQPS
jgi:hypothetical protein